MRRRTLLSLVVTVFCFGILASPLTALSQVGTQPPYTSFGRLVLLMGFEPSEPGFRLGQLDARLTFDPANRLMLADWSADLTVTGDTLADIENWALWPAEWVTGATLDGKPVAVSEGVQVPGFGGYHTLCLSFGEAGVPMTRGSVARLIIRTKGEIPPEIESERYGIVQDLQQPINELCALCPSGSTWTLEITVPSGWSAISIGKQTGVDSTGAETTTFAWTVPVSKMGANFMVIAGPYSRVKLDLPGNVGLWLLQEDMAFKDGLSAAVSDVLKRANQVMVGMGMPALEELEVVNASVPGQSVSGKGPYGLVLVEYGRGNTYRQDSFLRVLSHEAFHQWFPGRVELDFLTGIWLSEGMATYFTTRHLLNQWPPEKYYGQKGYQPSSYSVYDASRGMATISSAVKTQVIYLKGAWVASALRATVGEEAFNRTLRRFYLTEPTALQGTPEFQAIAEEESGLDLDRFFEEWLGTAKTPEIRLDGLTLARAPGGWLVKGTVVNRSPIPLPPAVVSVVRDGTAVNTTTIVLPDIPGQGRQEAPFEIAAPSLFSQVVLDPDADILNTAESDGRVMLLSIWAGQPWVIAVGGVVLAVAFVLIIGRLSKWSGRSGQTDRHPE